jgi:hypothetical protein
MIVDVAPQLLTLLGSHARIPIRLAVLKRCVARWYLPGLHRSSRPGARGASSTLTVLRKRRKRRKQHRHDAAENDQPLQFILPLARS